MASDENAFCACDLATCRTCRRSFVDLRTCFCETVNEMVDRAVRAARTSIDAGNARRHALLSTHGESGATLLVSARHECGECGATFCDGCMRAGSTPLSTCERCARTLCFGCAPDFGDELRREYDYARQRVLECCRTCRHEMRAPCAIEGCVHGTACRLARALALVKCATRQLEKMLTTNEDGPDVNSFATHAPACTTRLELAISALSQTCGRASTAAAVSHLDRANAAPIDVPGNHGPPTLVVSSVAVVEPSEASKKRARVDGVAPSR